MKKRADIHILTVCVIQTQIYLKNISLWTCRVLIQDSGLKDIKIYQLDNSFFDS